MFCIRQITFNDNYFGNFGRAMKVRNAREVSCHASYCTFCDQTDD